MTARSSPRRAARWFASGATLLVLLVFLAQNASNSRPVGAQGVVYCPSPPAGMKFLYDPQLRHPFDNPNESEYTCAYIEDPAPTFGAATLRLTIRWMTGPPEWKTTNVYCHDSFPSLNVNERTGEMSGHYLDLDRIVNSYFKTVGDISPDVAAAGAIELFSYARQFAIPCPDDGSSSPQTSTPAPTATVVAATEEPTATPENTPGGLLGCPGIAGFEIAIGSGEVRDAGAGNYQRYFACRYFDDDGNSGLQISARWDWAAAPAGSGPTSCGLPPLRDVLGSGNKYGYNYSPTKAALVSWQESNPTGLSHDQMSALAAPLLPAAEALAVPCPGGDADAGVGGAVATGGSGDTSPDTSADSSGTTGTDDGSVTGDGDAATAEGSDELSPVADFILGEDGGEVSPSEAAGAAAAAAGLIGITSLILVWLNSPELGSELVSAGRSVVGSLTGGGGDLETPDVPRVEPLQPDLPPVEVEIPVLTQDVVDRWTALGADGQGRVFDVTGQQIATIDGDGVVTDLGGRPITAIEPEFGVRSFTDADGRVIEYSGSGQPVQRTETASGPAFTPVEDLPTATSLRPDLDANVAARWTGVGAGPDGEIHGADGSVIGRIDVDGNMRTLDGRTITGYAQPEGGRVPEVYIEGGETLRTPGAGPAPAAVEIPAGTGGDDELAGLVRQTTEAQAAQRANQAADTSVRDPNAAGDTSVRPPTDAPDAGTAAAAPDAAIAASEVDAPAARPGADADADGTPRPTDTPEADGADGPRGASVLGAALDAQGLIDSVQRDLAAGRSVGEAVTRGVTGTWAGNAIGDVLEGSTDVRMTLLGASILPNGVNNILPDQFAANTVTTGIDAWGALVGDAATSLGEGELSTSELDQFATSLADRPGADPYAGYARMGDLLGEELGDADMNPVTMLGNLAEDFARMDEQDVIVEQALEASASFEQEAFDGTHGTILRGLSTATRVATDPPDAAEFASDSLQIARVAWDDFTGGGDTGGFGPGFWEEIAEHNNESIRGIPVVGTVFDGYAQLGTGLVDQGPAEFGTEMVEGAAALAEEGAMLAAETAAQATAAASDYAVATYDSIASWF